MRLAREQSGCRHDLARLAVAALHYFKVEPGILDSSTSRRCADRFYRRDRVLPDRFDGQNARAHRGTVEMHCAGTAQRLATAELRAGHAQHVTQYPEKRRVSIDIDAMLHVVHFDRECHGLDSRGGPGHLTRV